MRSRPGKQNERASLYVVSLWQYAVRTHLVLREELVVGGQVGRSDRRRHGVLLRRRRRPRLTLRLRSRGQHGGDDVPGEPLGDEVHGRAAAVSVEHTVECLREIKRFGD